MSKLHQVTFKEIEGNEGCGFYSWSELFQIQKWTDEQLLNYFWKLTEIQKNTKPYRDLVNLIVEIERRGLVDGDSFQTEVK